ncbi:MAG: porin family protein [Prevotella sp.]|nr:porin family protein [Prevotella sp.]
MKKILMTLAAIAMATTMNAQFYIGGGIGYSHSDINDVKTDQFKILPEFGYNLDDQISVGVSLGYTHSKSDDVKSDGFEVAPYLRYTFAKWSMVNAFVDLGLDYAYTKVGDVKVNAIGAGLFPGVAVNLNDKISFVTKIGALSYVHASTKRNDVKVKGDEFNVGIDGSNLQFSVYYNF